jgi:hypothetical protein
MFPLYSVCQESTGQTIGNFTGIQSARINPSLINSQKVYLNFNIIAPSALFQSDFAYLPKEDVNIYGLIFGTDTLPSYSKPFVHYKYVSNIRNKNFALVTNIYGPSFMLSTKKQSFGFHTAFRNYGSANDIPYEIPVFATESQGYSPYHHLNFNDNEFQIAELAWTEFGVTFATQLYKLYNHQLDIGITLNGLMGASGTFLKVYDLDYVVIDGKTVDIFNMDVDAGFSLPIDYNTNEFVPEPYMKGKGIGMDIGITYTRLSGNIQYIKTRRNCEYEYLDYDWRIGASLLDAGAIQFNKSAELHVGRNVDVYWDRVDSLEANSIHQIILDVSEIFLGDAGASLVSDNFRMALPTALSLQFDWHINKEYYINTLVVQPIEIYKYQVRRPALLSVVPRYESIFFEFSMPVSLYNYNTVRLGASVRFGPLTIGTERLGVLLGFSDVSGLDIYASIKFGFLKGKCYNNRDIGACFNSDFYESERKSRYYK